MLSAAKDDKTIGIARGTHHCGGPGFGDAQEMVGQIGTAQVVTESARGKQGRSRAR